jgi:hypothetical protein
MEVLTSSLEVLAPLHTRIVLLMQNIQALFILIVDSVVFAKVNLSFGIDHVFFAELQERPVVLVHVLQKGLYLNLADFEIDGLWLFVVVNLHFSGVIFSFV